MKRLRQALGPRRFRRVLAGLTLTTAGLLCSVAQATGGGGHGELHVNWFEWKTEAPPVGWFIIDFIVFLGLLVYFTRKPIKAAFRQRHERIKLALDEAKAVHDQAVARYENYKGKLANVEDEAGQFVARGREDGAAECDRILAAGRQYSERLRVDSVTIVEQEVRAANLRLQREAARKVLDATEEILKAEIADPDRKRLIEEAIIQLENGGDERPVRSRKKAARRPHVGGAA